VNKKLLKIAYYLIVLACCYALYMAADNLHRLLPAPDDETLYLEAMYRLAEGTFSPAASAFPSHHALRWSVTLTGAAVIMLRGLNRFSYLLLVCYPFIVSAVVCALIGWHLSGKKRRGALLAGLTPLLLPNNVFSLRILSEPISFVYFGVAVLILSSDRIWKSRRLCLLTGVILAVALNATWVVLLSLPLFPLYLLARSYLEQGKLEIKRLLISNSWIGLGILVGSLTALTLEYLMLGEWGLQFRMISNGHLSTLKPDRFNLNSLLDYHRLDTFIFSFLFQSFRDHPSGMAGILIGSLVLFCCRRQENRSLRALAFASLVSILILEIVALAAVDKLYYRYISLPLAVLIVVTLTWAGTFDKERGFVESLGGLIVLGLLSSQALLNFRPFPVNWQCGNLFTKPIIAADLISSRDLLKPRPIGICVDTALLPGLVPTHLAISVASFHRYENIRMLEDCIKDRAVKERTLVALFREDSSFSPIGWDCSPIEQQRICEDHVRVCVLRKQKTPVAG
jgi:hypothetical protein